MEKKSKAKEAVEEYKNKKSLQFDPNGSWTGVTKEKYEKPVQDADDL